MRTPKHFKYKSMDVEKIVREYIDRSLHMSLATTSDGKPWVCEVHFVYDDNLNIYWRSLLSRRHSREIAVNPNVAGNIVRQHAITEFPHAVYFEGPARLITDPAECQKVFPLFQKRLGFSEAILEEAQRSDGMHFYTVSVRNWYAYGKFDQPKFNKYQLEWNGGARN